MKSSLKSLLLATTTATLMASTAAVAYEQGDILIKGGAANVSPDDSSGDIVGLAGNDGVAVDSDTQLGLTLTYMYSDKIGVELLAATPFKHEISGTGSLAGVPVAETNHLPPTVTVNYYPLASNSKLQPYVGAGINYTNFLDTDSHLAGTNVELDDSWGLAAHAGIDYAIDDHWSLNAALWYIDIDTEATLSGAINAKVDVQIDPMVYMVGLSYKF